ncbi:YcaO-like family protein [Thiotrichales bacterium 19X7-9]|nr:YcaO-like family protein [Thiotrichales bacterium 19X7-9]
MRLANSLRSVTPLETLERIESYLDNAQITRLANISHLDEMNLPVFCAIRPLASSLTVSQGKGLSENEAKISAYMESLEVYFAETIQADILNKPYGHNPLFINPNTLSKQIIYSRKQNYQWCQVESLLNHKRYYIPIEFLSIDTTDKAILLQGSDTTGLASGNTKEEALVHSLFECIERDNITSDYQVVNIDIDHPTYQLLSKDHQIQIRYYQSEFNSHTFGCFFKHRSTHENQIIFSGYGCHFDKHIALNRALTEAIQAKLTLIAGSRDDIDAFAYRANQQQLASATKTINFSAIASESFDSVDTILKYLKSMLQTNGFDALVYIYHQQSLCFLKSILIKRDLLAL